MAKATVKGQAAGASASSYLAVEDDLGDSLTAIGQIMYDISGIVLDERKKELVKARLRKRLAHHGFTRYAQYVSHVQSKPGGAELDQMVDLLTTNKTSFFRELRHFDFLRDQVLPQVSSGSGLRIWSAGCSSGEEPYSLTILLNDVLSPEELSRTRILATDLSAEVLTHAQAGVYDEAQMADVPDRAVRTYFLTANDPQSGKVRYGVKPALRRLIRFARLNLMGDWPMSGPFDVILCRNVMIYFDTPTRERLVARFRDLLPPGGHLLVGHSESLNSIAHGLEYVQPAVYRK